MGQILDFIMHLDREIPKLVAQYGGQIYAILFLVIFAETGLVVTPFLPGDSLLFAVGMACHSSASGPALDLWRVIFLLSAAAIVGDQVNYRLGKWLGPKIFKNESSKIFKKSHLQKTEEFYEKYGSKTVTIARFVPIVRTFAPFVAGMAHMPYGKFCAYSVAGAVLWVSTCVGSGYLLFSIPLVREHFELGLIGLILLSMIPMIIEFVRHRREAKNKKAAKPALES